MKRILSLSRSYLSHLMPALAERHEGAEYLHIVQTDVEERRVVRAGGRVVLNLERVVRKALRSHSGKAWTEPADFRSVTGFAWCPIMADRNLPSFPQELRGHIAGALHEAIGGLFEAGRYDAFVSEPVVLFPTHLLLYFCRLHGVRRLLWSNTYFPGYFYFSDGCDNMSPTERNSMDPGQLNEVAAVVAQYVLGVLGDCAGPVYHPAFSGTTIDRNDYLAQRRGRAPLVLREGPLSIAMQAARLIRAGLMRAAFPWASDYMSAGAISEHYHYLRCLTASKRGYDDLPSSLSVGNIVFPLQYEPEGSLLYFAPEIGDQISFVETLLRALPAGFTLWIKEHPNQFGALSLPAWRRLKRKFGNVRFIHGRRSGRELIRLASGVVTISSSMGMDGLLLGRPVIVAGRVFYRNFCGAIPVSSPSELVAALAALPAVLPSRKENVAELINFARSCWRGDPQPSARLFEENNLRDLARAIDEATLPISN